MISDILSRLEMKSAWPEPTAIIAAAISGTPKIVPRIIARPQNGSRGSLESTWPTGNIVGGQPSLIASMPRSSAMAASTAEIAGGSGAFARNSRGSRPRATLCSEVDAKLQRCISGAGRHGIAANWSRVYMRYTLPDRTRPARPFRWTALLWHTHTVSSEDMRLAGSYESSRWSPVSTTMRTSLIVTELSAMFVARMIFTCPSSGSSKICCCSSRVTDECNFKIQSLSACSLSISLSCKALISAQPGRKHSKDPWPISSPFSTSKRLGYKSWMIRSASFTKRTSLVSSPHQCKLEVISHEARPVAHGRTPWDSRNSTSFLAFAWSSSSSSACFFFLPFAGAAGKVRGFGASFACAAFFRPRLVTSFFFFWNSSCLWMSDTLLRCESPYWSSDALPSVSAPESTA
mmetsp:Transcript_67573/g.206963  ORF Transcript_67573/g.206963 Transcript_67573/m.206963 type:complete len:404 (+) Transcript_67573:1304-2515(+)